MASSDTLIRIVIAYSRHARHVTANWCLLRFSYANRPLLFRKITVAYSKNYTKHITTICRQSTEIFIAYKVGATYSIYRVLKG
jgi:hypothetical protein